MSKAKHAYGPLIVLLLGIWLLICGAILMVENRWSLGAELITSLPANLDEQQPSITIYAK